VHSKKKCAPSRQDLTGVWTKILGAICVLVLKEQGGPIPCNPLYKITNLRRKKNLEGEKHCEDQSDWMAPTTPGVEI